ncbi:MAG: methyltransferase domain-containing protein [Burkholderiales bacterium]
MPSPTPDRPTPNTPAGAHDDFSRVDTWDDQRTENWVKALELRAAGADQVRLRKEIVDVARLRAGQCAIEIGSGTGPLLRDLAPVVGPTGRVIGIEPQAGLARFAREQIAAIGQSGIVEVRNERAIATTIAPRTADVCIAQTVLIHVPLPERGQTIEKMIDLTRSGGRVISADQDAESWVIDHPDRALTRRITAFYVEQRFTDGWWARRSRGAFMRAGLKDVESRAIIVMATDPASYEFEMAKHRANNAAQAGWITKDEAARWWGELEACAAAGQFFTTLNFYVTCGVKGEG